MHPNFLPHQVKTWRGLSKHCKSMKWNVRIRALRRCASIEAKQRPTATQHKAVQKTCDASSLQGAHWFVFDETAHWKRAVESKGLMDSPLEVVGWQHMLIDAKATAGQAGYDTLWDLERKRLELLEAPSSHPAAVCSPLSWPWGSSGPDGCAASLKIAKELAVSGQVLKLDAASFASSM